MNEQTYRCGRCQVCHVVERPGSKGTERARCPECGRAIEEHKPVQVGRFQALLVAVALLLLVAIAIAALDSVVGNSPVRGRMFGFIYLANPDLPPEHRDEPREPVRVPEAAVWIKDGALRLAETHAIPKHVFLQPDRLAQSAVPPLTGIAWLEPSIQGADDRGRTVHVLTLPLWLVVVTLTGGILLWFRRVHRRGGFYLGRRNVWETSRS